MKIENQLNLKDRTLLSGVPLYDAIPQNITIAEQTFNVIGISYGIKKPYVALEIEKANVGLKGKTIKE